MGSSRVLDTVYYVHDGDMPDMHFDLNEKQRTVVATSVMALITVAVFFIPWRIRSSGDIMWAPFYRGPAVAQSVQFDDEISSRYVELKGHPLYGYHVLQILLIGIAGVTGYWLLRDPEE